MNTLYSKEPELKDEHMVETNVRSESTLEWATPSARKDRHKMETHLGLCWQRSPESVRDSWEP